MFNFEDMVNKRCIKYGGKNSEDFKHVSRDGIKMINVRRCNKTRILDFVNVNVETWIVETSIPL